MFFRKLILVGALVTAPALSHAAIEFAGYMKIAGEAPKFVLVDTQDKKTSGWLAVGGVFKDYTIVAFDPKTEMISIKKGEATSQVPLKLSRARDDLSDMRKAIDTSTKAIRDIP